MLPLLFVQPSRKRTSASTSQYSSAVTGGPIAALLKISGSQIPFLPSLPVRCAARKPSSSVFHPSLSAPALTASRDFSVESLTDYSLRQCFFNIARFLVCKKVSTRTGESQDRKKFCAVIGRFIPAVSHDVCPVTSIFTVSSVSYSGM